MQRDIRRQRREEVGDAFYLVRLIVLAGNDERRRLYVNAELVGHPDEFLDGFQVSAQFFAIEFPIPGLDVHVNRVA
jgi:hypothetical protein